MTRKRRWTWWHVALVVVGVPVLAAGGLLAAVAVSLSGGIDELFRGDPPREGDREVVAAREAASVDLTDRRAALAQPALQALPGGRVVGGGVVRPPCQEGQHNWKIDDDFDLICQLTQVTVVATESRGSFRHDMERLHGELLAAGWQQRESIRPEGLPMVLDDYWDELGPGTRASGDYSMDDLPSASYERHDGDGPRRLAIGWAEAGSRPDRITYVDDRAALRLSSGEPATAADLVGQVPGDGYAVVLSETVEYFHQ